LSNWKKRKGKRDVRRKKKGASKEKDLIHFPGRKKKRRKKGKTGFDKSRRLWKTIQVNEGI